MLCLHDSIRPNDPAVQRLLSAVEDAHSLSALILAAWQVARALTVHLVEAELAERARHPTTWPRCPLCGTGLHSKGFAKRQITSLFGPIQWRRRVGRCPHRCETPQVAPFDKALGVQPHQRTSGGAPVSGLCLGGLCTICDRRPLARLVQGGHGQSTGRRCVGGCKRLVNT